MATGFPDDRHQQHDRLQHWLLRWLLLSFLVWGAGLTGFWDSTSLTLYDQMKKISNRWLNPPMEVLLMEGGEAAFAQPPQAWSQLLDRLFALKAAQVVFLDLPSKVDAEFILQAAQSQRVVLGRHARHAPDEPGAIELEPIVDAAQTLPFGIISPGPSRYGVYRRQYTQLPLWGGGQVATVEAAALNARRGTASTEFNREDFLINFTTGLDDLPRINLEQALDGNLLQEVVAGRSVILALREARVDMGVHTPITPHDSPMSPAEFHAFALNTLLTDSAIGESPATLTLLVTALAALLALLSYRRLPDQWSLAVALAGVLIYLSLAWLVLLVYNYHLPLFEAAITHFLGLTIMLRHRRTQVRERIFRLLRRLSGHQQGHYAAVNFYDTDEHWLQISNLVTQLLDMQRVMFLERIPGDHRLKEIKSLNCTLDDIVERRRDYQRDPYLSAREKNGPLLLTKAYLTPQGAAGEELQYLTPLLFSGEVMGYWGFTINPENIHDQSALEKAVAAFSGQIGEMLHRRRTWQEETQRQSSGLSAWLGREAGDAALMQEVQSSTLLLEERLHGMEEVFHGQETGTILYNLFGNVMHVNRRMSKLSEALQIAPFNMTALDFISRLTGLNQQECRNILRTIILNQDNLFLPVTIKGHEEMAFALQLRPLKNITSMNKGPSDTLDSPFPVQGILIELADVSQVKRFQELKELMVENVFTQLRNDLESVVLAVDMLTGFELPAAQKEEIVVMLKQKTAHTTDVIERARQKLANENTLSQGELFPVNPLDALEEAVRNLEPEQSRHRVGIEIHFPRVMSLTLVMPDRIVEVLEGILRALIHDAAEQSHVVVKGEERDGKVIIAFSNSGFGIPQALFQTYMRGEVEASSKEFQTLRESLRHVEAWGGKTDAFSDTGIGLRVSIELDVFISQT